MKNNTNNNTTGSAEIQTYQQENVFHKVCKELLISSSERKISQDVAITVNDGNESKSQLIQ
jgi:hypothetical protein